MSRLAQDTRLALRGFRRTPTFTATAVLILGLGIGMAVAMVTVFNAVLLRRLPVREQDRLVVLWTYRDPTVEIPVEPALLEDLRHRSRTTSAMAGFAHWGAIPMPMVDGDEPLTLTRATVTANFFQVLAASPVLGRFLQPEDGATGAAPVMVISYGAWRRVFGGDRAVIGRQLLEPYTQSRYTIIGVAPAGLDYPLGADHWVTNELIKTPVVDVVARLAPGATPAAAQAEFFAAVEASHPWSHPVGARVTTFTQAILGDVRPALVALTAAVALLLVIACVNVGNLLLLRAATRARELAVRRALGATAGDIARQLLVESVALAVAGGALGVACAQGLLRLLAAFGPARLPRTDEIRLSGVPVGAAAGVTLLTVLLFGVLPAVLATRGDLGAALRLDGRSGRETRRGRRLRQWLVSAQVALALIMLTGAGLLARSLARLQSLDLGYIPDHLSLFHLSIPVAKYDSLPKWKALGEVLERELRAVPGVASLSPILIPPFFGANVWQWTFEAEGGPQGTAANPMVPVEVGGAEYFRTLGIPLLRGRGFLDTDREGAPDVAVVSEGVARRYWPGQDPIGQRIRVPGNDSAWSRWRTVVGVTGDIHYRRLRDPTMTVFLPWRQSYWQGTFAVRTTGDLAGLLPALRRAVRGVDPQLTLWQPHTMDELLAGPLAQPRLSALLLSGFGLVALLLSAIGLYGVMASAVAEQTREIGVRMVLGATAARLRRAVFAQALAVCGSGALVGAVGALATSRLLTALLFQVSPADPIALLAAGGLLLVVALIAAHLPARRATRIDPAQALRSE